MVLNPARRRQPRSAFPAHSHSHLRRVCKITTSQQNDARRVPLHLRRPVRRRRPKRSSLPVRCSGRHRERKKADDLLGSTPHLMATTLWMRSHRGPSRSRLLGTGTMSFYQLSLAKRAWKATMRQQTGARSRSRHKGMSTSRPREHLALTTQSIGHQELTRDPRRFPWMNSASARPITLRIEIRRNLYPNRQARQACREGMNLTSTVAVCDLHRHRLPLHSRTTPCLHPATTIRPHRWRSIPLLHRSTKLNRSTRTTLGEAAVSA